MTYDKNKELKKIIDLINNSFDSMEEEMVVIVHNTIVDYKKLKDKRNYFNFVLDSWKRIKTRTMQNINNNLQKLYEREKYVRKN